jgi:hypothetical protein
MMRKLVLAISVLVFVTLMPFVNASFTKNPTFDLATSSSLPGAANAVYSIHLENLDSSEDAVSVSITIPVGYSINLQFITSKAGILAGAVSGECQAGTGEGSVQTTSTPGQFSMSAQGGPIGQIIMDQPSPTSQGRMEFLFSGRYSVVNHGCQGDFAVGQGFFINPSTPGPYTWGPSTATPTSGPPVTMVPRSGLTQTVNIGNAGTSTTATNVPEFPSLVAILLATSLIFPVAIFRKLRR